MEKTFMLPCASHASPAKKLLSLLLLFSVLLGVGSMSCVSAADAAVKVGSVDIPYLNQVRHYWRQNGHVNGANFESGSVAEVGKWSRESTTESDKQMQLIRFVRDGKKDVVLVNWQAHLIVASGSTTYGREHKSLLSADYVGFCRSYVEANSNSLFAFFQGAAGNLNPFHLVASYRDPENIPETPHEYGKVLGGHVVAALSGLKPVDNKGSLDHMRIIHPALDKTRVSFVDLELDAVSLGKSIGFVTAPYEMFDTNGKYVKENSPYEITFVITCANGRHNYIPSFTVFDYPELFGGPDTFAEASSEVAKGVGEDLAFSMVAMLNALYK